jgi:hypothetical protein
MSGSVSNYGNILLESCMGIEREQNASQFLTREKNLAFEELADVMEENPNFSPGAFAVARSVIHALPRDLPLPSIGIEPISGKPILSWVLARRQIVSVILSETGKCSYAVTDFIRIHHGVDLLRQRSLSNHLVQQIRAMMHPRVRDSLAS